MKKWLTILMLWACAAGLWSINASQSPALHTYLCVQTHQSQQQDQASAQQDLPAQKQSQPSQQKAPVSASIYPDDGTNGEATLSDSSILLQICQCRPIKDAHGLQKAKKLALLKQGLSQTLHLQSRWSEEVSSPVRMMPQSRYYVYTLQRMRC